MKDFIAKHFETIITIVCVLLAGIFWLATMDGIPTRVTKLEVEVTEIKQQLSKNDTKTDIILEDIKFIKQIILQQHMK